MYKRVQEMVKKVRYFTADLFAYFDTSSFDCDQVRHGGQGRQYKFAHGKFFVFSLTITTILYKYMYICLCAAVWQRYQITLNVVLNMEANDYD